LKIAWSSFALSDRDGIFTHIETDNPAAAIAVDERLRPRSVVCLTFPRAADLAG
jgi:plasmid stabilization system protein ParE